MLSLLFTSPIAFLVLVTGLTIALTIHEFSHAIVADKLGDPTPRANGRISLNPLVHLDPIGSLFLLIAGFGWGKPVQIDTFNLSSPKRDSALISLAGPTSNLLMATLLSLLTHFFLPEYSNLIFPLIYINISLAVFNLIPVYPLDGEKILAGLLPTSLAYEYQLIMHRYGTIILIFLVIPFFGNQAPISALISPIIAALSRLLLFI